MKRKIPQLTVALSAAVSQLNFVFVIRSQVQFGLVERIVVGAVHNVSLFRGVRQTQVVAELVHRCVEDLHPRPMVLDPRLVVVPVEVPLVARLAVR